MHSSSYHSNYQIPQSPQVRQQSCHRATTTTLPPSGIAAANALLKKQLMCLARRRPALPRAFLVVELPFFLIVIIICYPTEPASMERILILGSSLANGEEKGVRTGAPMLLPRANTKLEDEIGIDGSSIAASGFGFSKPLASAG